MSMQQDYINCVDCSGGYFFLYLGSQLYQSFDSGLNLLTWQAAQTALHQKQKRSEKKGKQQIAAGTVDSWKKSCYEITSGCVSKKALSKEWDKNLPKNSTGDRRG